MLKYLILFTTILLTSCATQPKIIEKVVEKHSEIEDCQNACSTGMVKEFKKGVLRCVCHETHI